MPINQQSNIVYPEQFNNASGRVTKSIAKLYEGLLKDEDKLKEYIYGTTKNVLNNNLSLTFYNSELTLTHLKVLSESQENIHKDIIRRLIGTNGIVFPLFWRKGQKVLKNCLDKQNTEGRKHIFSANNNLELLWRVRAYQEDIKTWLKDFGPEGRQKVGQANGAAEIILECGYKDDYQKAFRQVMKGLPNKQKKSDTNIRPTSP